MAVWDDLKRVIARLRDEQPTRLLWYPDPSSDTGRQAPFELSLAPMGCVDRG